jgi:hypothetical protein
MLLEDVIQVLPLLVPQAFVDQFVFIWGCERCIKILGQFTTWTYYYVKDSNHVYFACWGLHYGIENQTLFIDDEPSKAFQNFKCNSLFARGHKLSKNKVEWLDLASHLWPTLVGLLLARTIGVHYEISQIFKPQLTFLSNYF